MFPILYNEQDITYGVVPEDNGLGVLSDALSCSVTEERNGIYELEMTYPIHGIHYKDIELRHLLLAKPNFTDDPQLFRIYKITKTLNGNLKILARHISYDLSGSIISGGSASSAVSACALLSKAPFEITTDKNVAAKFEITEPSSIRSWLGGKAGSLLDIYGKGEYKYNNYDIRLLLNRGEDRGVSIKYGKNLLSLTQDNDSSNMSTGILVFWKSSEDSTVVYSSIASTGLVLDCDAVQCIDVSQDYESMPTVEILNQKAANMAANNNYTIPKNNIKLDFLQIAELGQRVDLCDIVHVEYPDFGIALESKCVKTVFNVLDERYSSIELGDMKSNFVNTFISSNDSVNKAIKSTTTNLQAAIKTATGLITGNSGGYVVLHDSNNDGEPDEILIMNTNDINTATKVWRWNSTGLGYSKTGYAGPYGLAMTIDGNIVADYITSGTMSANRVRTGRLEDSSGKNYFDLDSGKMHFENKFSLDSQNLHIYEDGEILANRLTSNEHIGFVDAATRNELVSIGIYNHPDDTKEPYINMRGDYAYSSGYDTSIGFSCNENSGISDIYMTGTRSGVNIMSAENNVLVSLLCPKPNGLPGELTSVLQMTTGNYSQAGTISLNKVETPTTPSIHLEGYSGNIMCVSLTQTSSRKNKKNIKDISDDEAKKILELNPVKYDFIDEDLGINKVGLIAEDVEDIIPNIVAYNTNNEISGINYIELIPYLIKVVQLQQKQIDELQNIIKENKHD